MTLNHIYNTSALTGLPALPPASVRTCVTSPPYYGLRDYGHTDQIGLEATPQEYILKLVAVFEEVRRVLSDDGTLWVNIGDSYSNKNLLGIPWRLAFALQDSGWYLRQDIIWSKGNAMPESVKDRCVKSHEYIFLLSKSEKYYFDYKAIQEPMKESTTKDKRLHRADYSAPRRQRDYPGNPSQNSGMLKPVGGMANKRSVWEVNTKPFKGAHFAVFPSELILPCVLAGSAEGDVVLDPFMGSGTTAEVAMKYGRKYIGYEINEEYIKISDRRLAGLKGSMFTQL